MLTVALGAVPHTLESQTFSRWSTPCDGLDNTASIALGDLDGDGDLDVVFGNGMHLAQTDWVLSNDGYGMLYGRRALGDSPDPSYGVALGDLDGDRDLDVVVTNDAGALTAIYRNDGKGNFSALAYLGNYRAPQPRRAVALGDLDMDGDLDAVLVGLGQDHIYLNEERGRRWSERALGLREAGGGRATGVALADVDGDRDIDIVVPGRYETLSVVFINDGRAGFAETRSLGAGPEDVTFVAVGDVDGDGDPDIVAAHWEQPHIVYLNDGRGHFKKGATFGSGREQTWTVALGDMDLDGDLDAVVGNVNIGFWRSDLDGDRRDEQFGRTDRDEPSRLYLNDGAGRFLAGSSLSTGTDNTRPVAVGDLDGDGDLDVVMGNTCQPNHIFFNPLRSPKSP
ncbi:MAG: hypothetical protein A3H97_20505 [Acidobacteria bacterium RIFCSPLOWO2_02_FULL_65_29]|nr:MAG: hypothetical protein A3H97_20505 [Acidobacteria bacterium RIFCSPLOWO2_02_FULL_65_29]